MRHAEQRLSQTEAAEAAQAEELGGRLQELRRRQEQLGTRDVIGMPLIRPLFVVDDIMA